MKTHTHTTLAAAQERMQQLRAAREQMAQATARLMEHSPEEQLAWTLSTVDLMEALYYAYEQQLLTDDTGLPLPFSHIVRHCCEVLHVKLPLNPYAMALRGKERKGVKQLNYMSRYLRSAHPQDTLHDLLPGIRQGR